MSKTIYKTTTGLVGIGNSSSSVNIVESPVYSDEEYQNSDLNQSNHDGKTAIMIASEQGNEFLVKALIENGADEFDLKVNKAGYEYLLNQEDFRNISCTFLGCEWNDFIHYVLLAVENHKLNKIEQLPQIKLNSQDNSVSLFFEAGKQLEDGIIERQAMEDFLLRDYVVEQLKFQAKKLGISPNDSKELFEIDSSDLAITGVLSCKFNISPESLDSILKTNDKYRGYRNNHSGGVLSLREETKIKEGKIMLFPLRMIEDGIYDVRSAGCQFFEIPALQLMRLLPNYESEILPRHQKKGFRFHWIPKELDDIGIDRNVLFQSMQNVIDGANVKVLGDGFENLFEMIDLRQSNNKLIVSPIDEIAYDFYNKYGNIGGLELKNCSSCEVSSKFFLQEIKKVLQTLGNKEQALEQIDKMIIAETKSELSDQTNTIITLREVSHFTDRTNNNCRTIS